MRNAIFYMVLAGGLVAARANGEALYLEGEIHAAFDWNRLFLTTDGGPLVYRGVFAYEANIGRATFEVVIGNGVQKWPSTDLLSGQLYDGIVTADTAGWEVGLTSQPVSEQWKTSFALMLDATNGEGQWYWSEGPADYCTPMGCAPSLPPSTVSATITAFRVVPEPSLTLLMALALVVTAGEVRSRSRARLACEAIRA